MRDKISKAVKFPQQTKENNGSFKPIFEKEMLFSLLLSQW